MCLYGHDLDETTSPIEAGLSWVIGELKSNIVYHLMNLLFLTGKDRKETGDFIGAEGVRRHLKDGPPRRRVGLIVEGAPARGKILL